MSAVDEGRVRAAFLHRDVGHEIAAAERLVGVVAPPLLVHVQRADAVDAPPAHHTKEDPPGEAREALVTQHEHVVGRNGLVGGFWHRRRLSMRIVDVQRI